MITARQYVKGEKITVPGLYTGLPIDTYHGDCTDGPGISSSGLRTIELQTPAHYWATSYLNPDRLPEERKDYFSFGKAAHDLLLGEDGFRKKYAIRPDKWDSWRTDASKTWRVDQELAGLTVLVPEQVEAIRGIARSLAAEPLVQQGILQGAIEQSMIWRDPATGVWLKSRPDVIPHADGVLVDIKTTTDASPRAIERACLEHGYPMQGALAGIGMREVMNIEMTDFVLIWVEKEPPNVVSISAVDPNWIYWGRRQIRRATNTFARCLDTGKWPGYEGERTVYLPDWLSKRFEAEAKNGLIPEESMA